jgi:TPR repeat protein
MDNREAARLFKLAADQGNANARTALNQITQQPQSVCGFAYQAVAAAND